MFREIREARDCGTQLRWFAERRDEAIEYLARHGVKHGRLHDVPAWHAYPRFSVWAIESEKAPGFVGWWVVCGDCPTDYVTCTGDRTPRSAVEMIEARWREAVAFLEQDVQHPDFVVGQRADARKLAPLLASRAECLRQLLADDSVWL
jgi:hypothetical protein